VRAIAIALFVAATGSLAGAQAGEVLLAVDLGSHLQPIAQMRDGAWVATARGGLGRLAPRDWTRWDITGRTGTIRLGVREPSGRCASPRRLAVAETSPRQPSTRMYVGVAASGPLAVDAGGIVSEGSAEWKRLQQVILPLFERREREHGLSAATLARLPVTIDRAFRSGSGATVSYYFEASKRIPDAGETPEEDPRGVVRLTVSGWLRDRDGRLAPAGSKGELHWDPLDDAPVSVWEGLWPLGAFRHNGQQIWVMHERVGTRDSFTLYALSDTVRPLLTQEAAAC
jgi:hypothetical protein